MNESREAGDVSRMYDELGPGPPRPSRYHRDRREQTRPQERPKPRRETPWYTSADSFDAAFGLAEWHGPKAFIRTGDDLFRTYFINSRGDEQMGSTWNYLD